VALNGQAPVRAPARTRVRARSWVPLARRSVRAEAERATAAQRMSDVERVVERPYPRTVPG